jgi:hypothetical protein
MTDLQALQFAIETMRRQAYLAEPEARDWRKYGDTLLFNKLESRQAAEYADRLIEAANVLEALKTRMQGDV